MTPGDRRALKTIAVLVLLGTLARWRGPETLRPDEVEYSVASGARPHRDSVLRQSVRMSKPLGRGERVDISRAGVAEIDRLPGIGPTLASRIVAHRGEHGVFRSIEDLRRVPGIGESLSARLAPHVLFQPASRSVEWLPMDQGLIRVNTASPEELTRLPGIGVGRAAAIIAYREVHGPFKSLGDLTLVPGIGPATVKRLESLIRIP